jgi:hypothetical protein
MIVLLVLCLESGRELETATSCGSNFSDVWLTGVSLLSVVLIRSDQLSVQMVDAVRIHGGGIG